MDRRREGCIRSSLSIGGGKWWRGRFPSRWTRGSADIPRIRAARPPTRGRRGWRHVSGLFCRGRRRRIHRSTFNPERCSNRGTVKWVLPLPACIPTLHCPGWLPGAEYHGSLWLAPRIPDRIHNCSRLGEIRLGSLAGTLSRRRGGKSLCDWPPDPAFKIPISEPGIWTQARV